MKNVYTTYIKKFRTEGSVALVTIVQSLGSTPQVSGASALFSEDALLAGTVGGGFLEADAHSKAIHALKSETSHIYDVELSQDMDTDGEAICGGCATILLDANPSDHVGTWEMMHKSLAEGMPGLLCTFIKKESSGKALLTRHWIEIEKPNLTIPTCAHHGLSEDLLNRVLREKTPSLSIFSEKDDSPWETWVFLEPLFPRPHLFVVGAGHIGQAVSHLGNLLDFELTVIDDRPEFANREKCPDADHIIVDDIQKTMQEQPISQDTYIVIVTRGHQNDADALRHCIHRKPAYIGMIGSKRKVALMRKQFIENRWATATQFDRVYAPIGIDIQSKTVQEIAVSIAAQLVQVRQRKRSYSKDEIWSGP